jgi:GNAT superfamily N-acetyltransferase
VTRGKVTIRQSRALEAIAKLEADNPDAAAIGDHAVKTWWIARNVTGGAVAYAAARMVQGSTCYLAWARVLKCARGHRLQRRLIQARLAWARKHRARWAVTYTSVDNVASMRSLIACGFKPYLPAHPWVDGEWVYWQRAL